MKVHKRENIEIDRRYVIHNRDAAIADIYDALVEIITNCDDSYRRLRKRDRHAPVGHILIETEHRRNNPSLLIVRDKAEGMTINAMREKLKRMGKRTSEISDRGFMARGFKDCTALGDIRVDSIVNGRHYACRLTRDLDFDLLTPDKGENATDALRDNLGIRKTAPWSLWSVPKMWLYRALKPSKRICLFTTRFETSWRETARPKFTFANARARNLSNSARPKTRNASLRKISRSTNTPKPTA